MNHKNRNYQAEDSFTEKFNEQQRLPARLASFFQLLLALMTSFVKSITTKAI
ncbi:MAG: hypothetical protein GQF41_2551 [Candidatus Rifleibacterium amylolyticum]|nr:MAG: hypothetical protein GQF41_2551 [Candidatus Rifleibacterium amylolyticum]